METPQKDKIKSNTQKFDKNDKPEYRPLYNEDDEKIAVGIDLDKADKSNIE